MIWFGLGMSVLVIAASLFHYLETGKGFGVYLSGWVLFLCIFMVQLFTYE